MFIGSAASSDFLAAGLMYGAGLRLMETMRLRAKDFDLERGELVVRNGKGGRDRITVLPARLVSPLRRALEIRAAARRGDTTLARPRFSAPSSGRCAKRGSSSARAVTRCATVSRLTCSKAATTSAPSSNCSATAA